MCQRLTAVPTSVGRLSDEQWLGNLLPDLQGNFSDYEIPILKKQLNLSDEQINAVQTLTDLTQKKNQSGKEEWYVETLRDRSEGKVESSIGDVENAQNKTQSAYEKLLNCVHVFRKIMGNKDVEFIQWVQDDSIINAGVYLTFRKHPDMKPEEIADEVFKVKMENLATLDMEISGKYKKWFKDRAQLTAYGCLMSSEKVWKDKVLLKKMGEERERFRQRMLSS